MALAALLIVLGFVAGLLRGGSIRNLTTTRFRHVEILVAGLALQLAVTFLGGTFFEENGYLVVLVANVAAAAFMFFNRHQPGMILAAAGLVLNAIVITLNGGMPVSERAVEIAGAPVLDPEGEHVVLSGESKLPWLTDVIPIPIAGSVLSPGDILLALGLAWLVYGRTNEPDQTV